MKDVTKAQEIFAQGSGKAVEMLTVWADANQRIMLDLVELSAAAAKEGVRLYAELQQAGLEAVTRTAERLQTTAEQAGKGIQQSVTNAVTKTKEVYAA